MTRDQGDWDGPLRPFIPAVDVNVRAADRRFTHLNEQVIGPYLRDRDVVHPDPGFGLGLDERFHDAITPKALPTLAKASMARSM